MSPVRGTVWSIARFVLPSLVVLAAWALIPDAAITNFADRRIADLTDVRNALAAYHRDHGSYPDSRGLWLGLYNGWGPQTADWVPGLAPRYIAVLPRDPRRNTDPFGQYLYLSDGIDYKLLSFYPGYDCLEVVKVRPDLADWMRSGKGPYRCHAYGYWSPGAERW